MRSASYYLAKVIDCSYMLTKKYNDKKFTGYALGLLGAVLFGCFFVFSYRFSRASSYLAKPSFSKGQFSALRRNYKMSLSSDDQMCKFGVISDLQYADIDDGTNFLQTRIRRYRQAVVHLQNAVSDWRKVGVAFAVHLGDVIDGQSKNAGKTTEDLKQLLQTFESLGKPTVYLWGNHEFYNLGRRTWALDKSFNSSLRSDVNSGAALNGDFEDLSYFDWKPCAGFRIVSIDTYDVSLLGLDKNDARYKKAYQILKEHNPNEDLNSPLHMKYLEQRFVAYNGAVGEKQLQWLDEILTKSDMDGENVIVLGHIPILQRLLDPSCLLWNFEEVLSLLHKHPSVRAYFAGHYHDALTGIDDAGLVHVVFPGIIEIAPDSSGHAVVTLGPEGIIIEGNGVAENIAQTIPLRSRQAAL